MNPPLVLFDDDVARDWRPFTLTRPAGELLFGNMDTWCGFYERIAGFRQIRYFDIEGRKTGLFSRALTSPCGKIRIPLNESKDDTSQIAWILVAAIDKGDKLGNEIFDILRETALGRVNRQTGQVYLDEMSLTPQLSVEPAYSLNHVSLLAGRFTTNLVGARVTSTATPLMFASALVQYISTSGYVSANLRLRWEYRPGSELFVVLNEERDARTARHSGLASRALIVKINRLFRF